MSTHWRGLRVSRVTVALLVLALIARLAVVAATPDYRPGPDPSDYDRYATAIEQGHYPHSNAGKGGPTAYRPPAYPTFLAVIYKVSPGQDRLAARVAQAFLGVLGVAMAGLIAFRVWGIRAGIGTLALAAVFPPMLLLGGTLLSEVLLVPLELGAVAAALQARISQRRVLWGALAGILAGLCVLTRPNAAVLLLPLALLLWTTPRRSPRTLALPAVLVAVAVLTVLPWTLRNAFVMNSFIPVSTQAGFTLAGTYNATAHKQSEFPAAWIEFWRDPAIASLLQRTPPREVPMEAALRSYAIDYAKNHPAYVGHVVSWNLRRVFDVAGGEYARFDAQSAGLPQGTSTLERVSFWALALLALAGTLTARARRAPCGLWLVPIVMLLSVTFVGYVRFRGPLDPFIIMLAVLACLAVLDRLRQRSTTGLTPTSTAG